MRGQVLASQSRDRRPEELFGLNIQVKKRIFKKSGKLCPDCGLADAADTGEKYTHAAPIHESLLLLASIHDSCAKAKA